ncbi:MAG: hypothetical protein ACLSCZ_05480 [Ruminococcus sp.]|jgi:hypothetical protein|nr:hypothetical protein [Ruminococcus bromii]
MIVKAPKKMLRIVFSVVMATILVLITIMVVNVIAHKDYISVEAEVSEVYTDTFSGKGSKSNSSAKYAIVEYTIEAKKYSSKYRLGNFHNVSEGNIITVRFNPNNYSDIYNDYTNRINIFFIVFLSAFDVFVFLALRKCK